jgi:hypothetical protein
MAVLLDVTKAESCLSLLDWRGSLGLPGNSTSFSAQVPRQDGVFGVFDVFVLHNRILVDGVSVLGVAVCHYAKRYPFTKGMTWSLSRTNH